MTVLNTVYVVLYFLLCGVSVLTAASKILALRNNFSRSLSILAWGTLLAAGSFLIMYPAVYRWIGAVSGIPTLGALLIYLCIFGFAINSHVLVRLWSQDHGVVCPLGLRRLARPATLYPPLGIAMVALYFTASFNFPQELRTGRITAETHPLAVYFFATTWVAIATPLLATANHCSKIRMACQSEHPSISRGLRAVQIGALLLGSSYALKLVPLTASSFGAHHIDVLHLGTPLLSGAGTLLVQYGYLAPALGAWMDERRDFRTLRPLWKLTMQASDPRLALAPPGPLTEKLALNVTKWYLPRRIMEISDAIHALHPWMRPEPADRVRQSARSTPTPDLTAACAAATLIDAITRKRQGVPPRPDTPTTPLLSVPPAEERAHLVRMATALQHA
ncbi:MAB_1171c family putative transporter [Streptomyces sp. NPDC059037]|uniref:MAB_1171c family putative transporter n=1 Tax=Streptomyces sp. NPDC059037 TaxID=3346710 RepID=UPI0036A3505F